MASDMFGVYTSLRELTSSVVRADRMFDTRTTLASGGDGMRHFGTTARDVRSVIADHSQ